MEAFDVAAVPGGGCALLAELVPLARAMASPLAVGVLPEELELLSLVRTEFLGAASAAVAGAALESRWEFESEFSNAVSQCAQGTLESGVVGLAALAG